MTISSKDDIVQQRLRRVAGVLLDDEALRKALTDVQGERLLDWGIERLQETAACTASLPDDDALPVLEEKLTAVRLIMRLLNDLVLNPRLLQDEDIVNTRLVRLGKNLQWLR